MWPRRGNGSVERSVPSVLRASGVVKTSSVGMFATYVIPEAVSDEPDPHGTFGRSPTVRSVPGPR
jgi:hypothetical protein